MEYLLAIMGRSVLQRAVYQPATCKVESLSPRWLNGSGLLLKKYFVELWFVHYSSSYLFIIWQNWSFEVGNSINFLGLYYFWWKYFTWTVMGSTIVLLKKFWVSQIDINPIHLHTDHVRSHSSSLFFLRFGRSIVVVLVSTPWALVLHTGDGVLVSISEGQKGILLMVQRRKRVQTVEKKKPGELKD